MIQYATCSSDLNQRKFACNRGIHLETIEAKFMITLLQRLECVPWRIALLSNTRHISTLPPPCISTCACSDSGRYPL